MSDSPVLVVGAGGFVGSFLARRLLAEGHPVHCLYHRNASRLPPAARHHQLSLLARESLHELVRTLKPRWVFNTAQVSPRQAHQPDFLSVGFSEAIQGLVNLLDSCRAAGVERFVHACSSTVYADVGSQLMDEATALAPASARGLCKLTERNLCLHYAHAGDLHIGLGRIFRAYGPDDRPEKLIETALDAQRAGIPVPLPNRPSRRDYIYIDDVSEALLRIASRPLEPGVEINIGSGIERRPDEILDQLEVITGRPIHRQPGAYTPGAQDRAHWCAAIDRAQQLLGWQPTIELPEGLRRTVRWYQADRIKPADAAGG